MELNDSDEEHGTGLHIGDENDDDSGVDGVDETIVQSLPEDSEIQEGTAILTSQEDKKRKYEPDSQHEVHPTLLMPKDDHDHNHEHHQHQHEHEHDHHQHEHEHHDPERDEHVHEHMTAHYGSEGESDKRMKITQGYPYPEPTQDELALDAISAPSQGLEVTPNPYSTIASLVHPAWAYNNQQQQIAQQHLLYMYYLQQQQQQQQQQKDQMFRDDRSYGHPIQPLSPLYPDTHYFVLVEQPLENQRKSYRSENRCILPNPLTISCRDFMTESGMDKRPMITDGHVTVKLVEPDGSDLGNHKASIVGSVETSLTQPLDENLTAQFSLKAVETSERQHVALLFTVNYRMKGLGSYEERIVSRPFVIHSNRKKSVKGSSEKERPVAVSLRPERGDPTREMEVWIKGKSFSDRIVVLFGDKQAKVIESTENLITVLTPMRDDIGPDQEMQVQVTIANKFPRDQTFSAEKKLTFTYTSPKSVHPYVF